MISSGVGTCLWDSDLEGKNFLSKDSGMGILGAGALLVISSGVGTCICSYDLDLGGKNFLSKDSGIGILGAGAL